MTRSHHKRATKEDIAALDEPAPEPLAVSPADVAFIQGHPRGVIKAMKPRLASNAEKLIHSVPLNTAAPTVSGTGTVGQTLIVSNGTWLFSPSISYQWRRDGANIAGATTVNYVLVAADSGHRIDAVVTATNTHGSASEPSSNQIQVA